MKVLKITLISLVGMAILALLVFFLIGYFQPKPAGLLVDTSPSSSVYINNTFVGKTPYKGTYKADTLNIKLVPEDQSQNLFPFETKITLVSGVQTIVRREFGTTEQNSSGDIISFDPISPNETSLVVVTTPENAQVSIDGIPRGFAPYKTTNIAPAEHQITIKAPNYVDRTMTLKATVGYRLTVFVKLAILDGSQGLPISATPVPQAKLFVLIGSTPTGFLRIRTEPATAGEEIAQVKPGEKYLYLATDSNSGWYKIQYEDPQPGLPDGITGWISNQFTKIVDQLGSPATPSAQMGR